MSPARPTLTFNSNLSLAQLELAWTMRCSRGTGVQTNIGAGDQTKMGAGDHTNFVSYQGGGLEGVSAERLQLDFALTSSASPGAQGRRGIPHCGGWQEHRRRPAILLLLLFLIFFAICSETSVVHPDLFEADNDRVLHDWCLHDEGGDGPSHECKTNMGPRDHFKSRRRGDGGRIKD
jgi:hypothetical protein